MSPITEKKILDITKNAKSKMEIMQLHGQLYYIYLHSVGFKRVKSAYYPKEKNWYTYAFWIVNLLTLLPIALSLLENPNAQIFSVGLFFILAPTYYLLGNYCIEKSLASEFKKIGVISKSSIQLMTIQYELLRTMWFFEKTVTEINPTIPQIEKCIEFSEAIYKDALPFAASYLRHPLTILFFGILFYIFNSKISEFVGPLDQKIWFRALPVVFLVIWGLIIGYQLHNWKFQDLQRGGKFLRSLRWALIEMRNNEYSKNGQYIEEVEIPTASPSLA